MLAVQLQPFCVVTVTVKDPPLGYPSIVDPIDSAYVHWGSGGGSCGLPAACTTVTVWFATVNVPVLDELVLFGSTVKLTAPVPLLELTDVI